MFTPLPPPSVTDPGDLPLRSQRYMPNSIATLCIRLARSQAHALLRRSCCGHMPQKTVEQNE
jgi:hypothetical protein